MSDLNLGIRDNNYNHMIVALSTVNYLLVKEAHNIRTGSIEVAGRQLSVKHPVSLTKIYFDPARLSDLLHRLEGAVIVGMSHHGSEQRTLSSGFVAEHLGHNSVVIKNELGEEEESIDLNDVLIAEHVDLVNLLAILNKLAKMQLKITPDKDQKESEVGKVGRTTKTAPQIGPSSAHTERFATQGNALNAEAMAIIADDAAQRARQAERKREREERKQAAAEKAHEEKFIKRDRLKEEVKTGGIRLDDIKTRHTKKPSKG